MTRAPLSRSKGLLAGGRGILWTVEASCAACYASRPHRAEALRDDARLTSVAYIGPKSRTERHRKTKIGTEVAHITRAMLLSDVCLWATSVPILVWHNLLFFRLLSDFYYASAPGRRR